MMNQTHCSIQHIPAVLWGPKSDRLILAAHGSQSHKADTVIQLLSEAAAAKGSAVLSFDLPEHGERQAEGTLCKTRTCVEELRLVLDYAKTQAAQISFFGCSLGAYLGLLALSEEPLYQALLLSPIVDLRRLTENMMHWFTISEEQLQAQQEIPTPIGQTIYWDDYRFIHENPITRWNCPTDILYGSGDDLCERAVISDFATRFGCRLRVLEQGEHYFHTPEQLAFYSDWLEDVLL